MFEIEDRSQVPHKIGGELPDHGAKIVLESTEMDHVEQAMGSWDRDPFGHRPHYLVDPKEFKIYKTADSTRAVIGTFDVSQPQIRSRCVFVAIHKQTFISFDEENSVNLGRLLRVICDIEGVGLTINEVPMNTSLGPDTLQKFEGIVPLYAFPGHDEITAPGFMDWKKIREGLRIDPSTPKAPPAPVLEAVEPPVEDETDDEIGLVMSYPETMDAPAEVEDAPAEVETTEEEVSVLPELEELKVTELKVIADDLGITSKGLKKAEIIEAINKVS